MESTRDKLSKRVVNAMSLIAQGYQSESEEEGEIEHETRKQTFIETKIKEIAAEIVISSRSGSENGGEKDVIVMGTSSKRSSSGVGVTNRNFVETSDLKLGATSSNHHSGVERDRQTQTEDYNRHTDRRSPHRSKTKRSGSVQGHAADKESTSKRRRTRSRSKNRTSEHHLIDRASSVTRSSSR